MFLTKFTTIHTSCWARNSQQQFVWKICFKKILPKDEIDPFYYCFLGSATPCASPPPWPSINQDDRQLLANSMASDFSVARSWFVITDQTPSPYPTRSLPTQFWHLCTEWSTVLVLSKPLIKSPHPVLTPVHRMEYCVGLVKAINHWRRLAWPRFEPGSPKWHTGTLSTTPQAHALPFITV
jgi:hypothetical protein